MARPDIETVRTVCSDPGCEAEYTDVVQYVSPLNHLWECSKCRRIGHTVDTSGIEIVSGPDAVWKRPLLYLDRPEALLASVRHFNRANEPRKADILADLLPDTWLIESNHAKPPEERYRCDFPRHVKDALVMPVRTKSGDTWSLVVWRPNDVLRGAYLVDKAPTPERNEVVEAVPPLKKPWTLTFKRPSRSPSPYIEEWLNKYPNQRGWGDHLALEKHREAVKDILESGVEPDGVTGVLLRKYGGAPSPTAIEAFIRELT